MRKAWVLFGAALALGCASSNESKQIFDMHMERAVNEYRLRRFDEARVSFEKAALIDQNSVEAWIGLGNACRELGNHSYQEAHNIFTTMRTGMEPDERKRKEQMITVLDQKGTNYHNTSRSAFAAAISLKPKPLHAARANLGLGMLYYERSCSPLFFPYSPDSNNEQASKKRQEERNAAIRFFEEFLKVTPEKESFAYKYLGFVYYTRGERADYEKAIQHFQTFLSLQQKALENAKIGLTTARTDQEKTSWEAAIRDTEKEISDIENAIGACKQSLGMSK